MNNDILLTILGLTGLYVLLNSNKKSKEGFRFADETANALNSSPSLPSMPSIRSDGVSLSKGSDLNASSPNFANPGVTPNYSTIANFSGQSQLLNSNMLSSSQAQAMLNKVGKGSPDYQQPQMIGSDMRYSSGLDATDPNNFIYNRSIFSKLKRRYGSDVDHIRGDIVIPQEQRGWFDVSKFTDDDLSQGYFASGYQDIQQEMNVKDSIFQRNLSPSARQAAYENPYGFNVNSI
jgi:hypothetical protein